MTKERMEEIDCPKCGAKQTETLWETINVTLNPELKEKLFQGEINRFRCKNCGNEAYISLPLLYHDMRKKYCVQYYPFDWLEDDQMLDDFSREGEPNFSLPVARTLEYMEKIHIVFEMGELVRYIIFRDKLSEKWEKAS
jgi:predicted nucleic-acid-binding Zn-ribbon protein